jgi:hypothetical protein
MKKIIIIIICGAIIFLNSCKKAIDDIVPGSNTMLLAYPAGTNFNALSSGLNYFNSALLPLKLTNKVDSVFLSANIGVPASQDLTINIGVDQGAFDAYSANPSNIVKYTAMPATYYNIAVNSVTIKAGQTNAKFKIAFYSSLFDLSQTGYLLPISISNDPGYTVNNGMKTVYFHIEKK